MNTLDRFEGALLAWPAAMPLARRWSFSRVAALRH